ncbi:MAG: EAL domain-containing protein [Eubacteriales bacterium]|nr:EAL domain-containing protein [Eubacteriales bacterium]
MPNNHLRIHSTEKRTILVVDDEMINRELLGMALSGDYNVLFASDGEEALSLIRGQEDMLSLVLLDLLMPVVSGMVVLKLMKESPLMSRIPVIVTTADHEAEVACLELGALDFIPKPYPTKNVILARVRRIIELSEDRQIILSTERDSLTGLYNREFFYNYAETFDQHHKNEEMDAIIVDINRFHIINERYGRVYADQILKHIADKLRDMVQTYGGIVCRREADTFLMYCPHRKDYEQILEYVSEGLGGDEDSSGRVRFRMGVYPNVDKSQSIEERFDKAKAAADTVRSNYTQNIAVYDNKLHEAELFHEQLTEDFDRAIREGDFKVFYQPKYNVCGEVPVLTSAEALIRWQHPKLGLISPGVFIPLFEQNGMIRRLDHYVWSEAAAQISRWKEKYGISVPVSVNVSRVDMFDPDIIGTFKKILSDNCLSNEELIPEITESAYTDDESLIISTVNGLRELGLRVEMDDFGTGYSSLGMISHLPIDALKLDMAFVRSAFSEQGDTKMIELIIDIADYLGVPVVAEGVETMEQVRALRKMGCQIVQGYYFSKPVPPEEFEAFIREKKAMLESEPGEMPEGGLGEMPEGKPGENTEQGGTMPARRPEEYADGRKTVRQTGGVPKKEKELSFARAAQVLASDYISILCVNMKTGRFAQYTANEENELLSKENSGDDFFAATHDYAMRVIHAEDRDVFLEAFSRENLTQELEKNEGFTITCRVVSKEIPKWVSLKAVKMTEGNDQYAVIGVNSIDVHLGRHEGTGEIKYRDRVYSRIVHALSRDYYSIYMVNTQTDEYVEFSSNTEFQELRVKMSGVNFFEDCRRNVVKLVHPDDLKMALMVWRKDNLMQELSGNGTVSVTYRLMFDGSAVYINCKVIRMTGEDSKYIVIGVSNVDAQMKREQEYANDLRSARNAAMRDALTGVKSKLAYNETEQEINGRISRGEQQPFAVALCDLNDLKTVNDEFGHKAGDQFIRDACAIICDHFKHSPVFRVGGDEFVAILQGSDFTCREKIVEEFRARNREQISSGGVVIACGLSDWKTDSRDLMENVFERADNAMYENKKELKAMLQGTPYRYTVR